MEKVLSDVDPGFVKNAVQNMARSGRGDLEPWYRRSKAQGQSGSAQILRYRQDSPQMTA